VGFVYLVKLSGSKNVQPMAQGFIGKDFFVLLIKLVIRISNNSNDHPSFECNPFQNSKGV